MACSMSAPERALYFFGRLLVRCFYRVTALGLENMPVGGFLLLPNHITWVDAIVLQLACPRPIRYIIDQDYTRFCACWVVFQSIFGIRVSPFAPRLTKSLKARSSVFFPRASWSAA